MPALFYLFLMFALGDAIGRRFYPFVSIPHRLASAFLCGLLLSSWWTYALAFFFSDMASPMLWGNLAFFITGGGYFDGPDRQTIKGLPSGLFKNMGNGIFKDVTAEAGLAEP